MAVSPIASWQSNRSLISSLAPQNEARKQVVLPNLIYNSPDIGPEPFSTYGGTGSIITSAQMVDTKMTEQGWTVPESLKEKHATQLAQIELSNPEQFFIYHKTIKSDKLEARVVYLSPDVNSQGYTHIIRVSFTFAYPYY